MIHRLKIWDFDGTLFDSPGPPSGYTKEDWWDLPESLEPPCVPESPPATMYLNPAKSALQRSTAEPKSYSVICTGRLEVFRPRIAQLLRNGGLKPKELFLRPGGPTVPYKIRTMRYLTKMLRTVREIEVWEDNRDNLAQLERAAHKLGFAFVGHRLRHNARPAKCPLPSRVASRYLMQ